MRPGAAARGVSFALALLEPCARAGTATRTSVLARPVPIQSAAQADRARDRAGFGWMLSRSFLPVALRSVIDEFTPDMLRAFARFLSRPTRVTRLPFSYPASSQRVGRDPMERIR